MKLVDISKKLNISISTISRVLSNDETLKIKDSTKQKILNFALENGIKINTKKKNDTILIITNYSPQTEIDDTYYLNLRILLEKELSINSFNFKIKPFTNNMKLEKYNILIGNFNFEQMNYIEKQNKNVIMCDSYSNRFNIDCVTFDYKQSVYSVLDLLTEYNHKEIAFIGGIDDLYEDDFRKKYFIKYLNKKNIFNEELIYVDKFNSKTGYEGTLKIFEKNNPTAIFVANDNIAIGCYKALKEIKKNIPKDVSIIGFNDLEFSEFMEPRLTTVHIYIPNIVKETVSLLLTQYNKKKTYSKKILLNTKIIFRDSVTKL